MNHSTLREILLEQGALSFEQWKVVEEQHQETGQPIDELLLKNQFITEERLLEISGRYYGVRWLDLPEKVSPSLINIVPAEFALRHCVLPINRENGSVTLAALDPGDLQVQDDLRMLTGCEVELVLAPRQKLLESIERNYGTTIESMIANLSGSEEEKTAENLNDIEDLQALAREPTVVNLVNLIIYQAVHEEASDIHIEPFENQLLVRYRIDGLLQEQSPPPKHLHSAIISRIKIMADLDIAERYTPQDGHIRMALDHREMDFRVSTVPTVYGEAVVMRILDKSNVMIDIAQLGFFEDTLNPFNRLLHRSHGIILVTGPTGSGKTTTLYAALNRIKNPTLKIITVEDPVEYKIEGINQMQVNPKRGLTFANGLRAIVRQDPDIIMVGEIRDFETAEIAIRSALTGHLVFSTLHTNNASGAVSRLLDMGVDPYLIASSVSGILAQRLVRKNCPSCLIDYTPERDYLMLANLEQENGIRFKHGAGCEVCRHQGYKGRSGIFELLVLSDTLRELILTRPSSSQIHQAAGIRSLRDYGMEKVKLGLTTLEEVVRVTQEDEIADINL